MSTIPTNVDYGQAYADIAQLLKKHKVTCFGFEFIADSLKRNIYSNTIIDCDDEFKKILEQDNS